MFEIAVNFNENKRESRENSETHSHVMIRINMLYNEIYFLQLEFLIESINDNVNRIQNIENMYDELQLLAK